jgi:hypothetical protein
MYLHSAGVTQLVECNLAKVDVASSNLVTRFPSAKATEDRPLLDFQILSKFLPPIDQRGILRSLGEGGKANDALRLHHPV